MYRLASDLLGFMNATRVPLFSVPNDKVLKIRKY